MPLLIAHLTDLHTVVTNHLCYGKIDTNQQLREAIAHLESLRPRPDLVLVSGDLTEHGSPEQYAALRKILGKLSLPIYLVPGNHDRRQPFLRAFADAGYLPAPGSPFSHFVCERWPLRLIGLDTMIDGKRRGQLCRARLAWLAARLAESTRETLIFMHHPPFHAGLQGMDNQGLEDIKPFRALIERHPQVRAIACGHLHRAVQTRIGEALVVSQPSTCHQVALNLAPNAGLAVDLILEPRAIGLLKFFNGNIINHISYVPNNYEQFRPLDPPSLLADEYSGETQIT